MELLGHMASLVMGVVLGIVGGGGSILTVPIMVYFFELAPTIATGHSLFVVGVAALVGCVRSMKKGEVNLKVGSAFAIPSIAGVMVSRAWILPRLPQSVLSVDSFTLTKEILIMGVFALLMIVASRSMIKKRPPRGPKENPVSPISFSIIGQGFMVGVVAGFVGAGGGFLIIPALVVLAGLSMRMAVGTSLFIIALQSLSGFVGDVAQGVSMQWSLLGTVTAVAIAGILLGSAFAGKIKEDILKKVFGWMVLVMGAAILLEQVLHLGT